MTSSLCLCVLSSATLRRRIPVVGSAICVLAFGVSNLFSYPAVSFSLSALRTGYAQSLPLLSVSRFRYCSVGRSSAVEALQSARMEGGSAAVVESVVVYVTVPNEEAGKKLAESIISERLAACVNRVPGIQSVYHWQGKIETDSEELLIIKTRKSLLEPLTQHVKANHEYEVPEVIALPILGGNDKYLEWIKSSTRD